LFNHTKDLFNNTIEFYFNVIEQHQEILKLRSQDALRALEKLSAKTKKNPNPEHNVSSVCPSIPVLFRRAAINKALGASRSFHTHLHKWNERKAKAESVHKKFTEKPPVPPRKWNFSPVFYKKLYKNFDGTSIILRLWTGKSWAWVKFSCKGQETPAQWDVLSPSLVKRKHRLFLHFPLQKPKEDFVWPEKIVEQIKNPELKICSVDLNINDDLAVCVIQKANGAVEATKFILGGSYLQHRRKRLLGIIATKRSKTRAAGQKGISDNVALWDKIRNIDEQEAHRVSRRIVDFALAHGATVIVFEHLGNYRPKKNKGSAKSNEKRAFWLRGKIFHYTKYKAFEHSVVTARISPKNTSRQCNLCREDVFRFGKEMDPNNPYTPGAPNFFCPNCQNRGSNDRMAAINVGRKFFRKWLEKPGKKFSGTEVSHAG